MNAKKKNKLVFMISDILLCYHHFVMLMLHTVTHHLKDCHTKRCHLPKCYYHMPLQHTHNHFKITNTITTSVSYPDLHKWTFSLLCLHKPINIEGERKYIWDLGEKRQRTTTIERERERERQMSSTFWLNTHRLQEGANEKVVCLHMYPVLPFMDKQYGEQLNLGIFPPKSILNSTHK